PTRGTAKITAMVQNVGDATYDTRPGQQNVQIFEVPPSGVVPMIPKKTCDFGTLRPGVTYRGEYERPWDTMAAEGSAPPSYKAMIVYDPDIRTDGNPKNDDIYLKDNQLQLPGARINELFRTPSRP